MLQSHEGKRVPEVTFRVREGNEWKSVTTGEIFDGRTVVVFSLPGAFTLPGCRGGRDLVHQRQRRLRDGGLGP